MVVPSADRFDETWRRLQACPPALLDREAAAACAQATMERCRQRLEAIVDRLRASGYVFYRPGASYRPPAADAAERLAALEALVGTVPLVLRAALLHLGSCNLMGTHPRWPHHACLSLSGAPRSGAPWLTDPLVVPSPAVLLEDAAEAGGGPFTLVLSGDELTKAGISGGLVSLKAPNRAFDCQLDGEPHGRTFGEMLLTALRHGGFAGFERDVAAPPALLEELTVGLPALPL